MRHLRIKKTEFDAIFTTTSTGRRSRDFEQANLHFGRLPGSRIEGERVGQLLGIKPWTDVAALERDLKNIRSPVILHLATHGFFLEDQNSDPNLDNLFHGSLINDSDNTNATLSMLADWKIPYCALVWH